MRCASSTTHIWNSHIHIQASDTLLSRVCNRVRVYTDTQIDTHICANTCIHMHAQHVTQNIHGHAQSERALYLATTYIHNSHIYIQNSPTLLYKTHPRARAVGICAVPRNHLYIQQPYLYSKHYHLTKSNRCTAFRSRNMRHASPTTYGVLHPWTKETHTYQQSDLNCLKHILHIEHSHMFKILTAYYCACYSYSRQCSVCMCCGSSTYQGEGSLFLGFRVLLLMCMVGLFFDMHGSLFYRCRTPYVDVANTL